MLSKIFKNSNSSIKIHSINKKYGSKQILNNVSFEISERDKIYLSGENGVGKTTLLKIIAGIIFPNSGKVIFDKETLEKNSRIRSDIGYMTTELIFYEMLSIYDNLTLIAALYKLKNIPSAVNNIVRRFHMEKYQYQLINELSSGTKRKFQLACALIHDPEFLILDEPFNTLDQKTINLLLDMLIDHTIIFTAHDIGLAYKICNKEFNIKNGNIFNKTEKIHVHKQQKIY